jgi:hypothetical protein
MVSPRPLSKINVALDADPFKGGHTKLATQIIHQLTEMHGSKVAAQMAHHQMDQLTALREVVDKEGIDCQFLSTRSYDIFFDETHAEEMYEFISGEQAKGTPWVKEVQWIDKDQSDRVSVFHIICLLCEQHVANNLP